MIDLPIEVSSIPTIFSYFFFLGMIELKEEKWDSFIKDDKFTKRTLSDKSKAHFFQELVDVKTRFRLFLDSNESMNLLIDRKGGASLVEAYINAFVIRIKKLRLAIQPTFYTTSMTKGKFRYVVMKTCWIDTNGNYVKKFTKLLGREDEVKIDGNIPKKLIEESEDKLITTMWNQYLKEYHPSSTPLFK